MAHDGKAALERFDADSPNIVILDLQLPRLDGQEVCREIRVRSSTPIIMLTVRDSDDDVVKGFGLGADDYVTKPFSPAQLIARVTAVLRRTGETTLPRRLTLGGLTLNSERHTVEKHDSEAVHLTQLEYRLMETMMVNRGQVLPADILVDRVWGTYSGDRAMLKQLVYRLRKQLSLIGQSRSNLFPA
jgi:DNA-binding response OmpR family regulator